MTRLEIEVGEIVLRDLPAEYAGYADGLGPLVEQRLAALAQGHAVPDRVVGAPEVSDRAALADLVARQVWSAARPHTERAGAP